MVSIAVPCSLEPSHRATGGSKVCKMEPHGWHSSMLGCLVHTPFSADECGVHGCTAFCPQQLLSLGKARHWAGQDKGPEWRGCLCASGWC